MRNDPLWLKVRASNLPRNPRQLLESMGLHAPPVDVETMIRALGICIVDVDNSSSGDNPDAELANPISGFAMRDASTGIVTIGVDRSEGFPRQRFILAHSLGHVLLHPLDHPHLDTRYGMEATAWNREANRFAAEVLMPADMLHYLILHSNLDTEALADVFVVTPTAMAIRIREVI